MKKVFGNSEYHPEFENNSAELQCGTPAVLDCRLQAEVNDP